MKRVHYSEPVHSGPMLNWMVNERCNFRCNYCYLPHDTKQNEHPACGKQSIEHISGCFDRSGRQWWIYITGGEPFLYPDFVSLCSALTQRHRITINTNLSTSNTVDFAERIDPGSVYSINAALHIQERERLNGVKDFLKKVLLFQKKGFQIRVEYVLYPPLFKRIEQDLAFLEREGVHIVNLKTFRGWYDKKKYPASYTESELSFISRHALDKNEVILSKRSFSFLGKRCSAGIDFFTMDPDGAVRRCSTSRVKLGNFFDAHFSHDTRTLSRICPFPRCSCPYDGLGRTAPYDGSIVLPMAVELCREMPSYIRHQARPARLLRRLSIFMKK